MCHPIGSGASSIFFSGSFFVFLFLLSTVPPRAQADLPTKPTGNGLSSMPTNSAREEARELHHISAVELAWLVLHALEVHSLELHSLEVHSLEVHSLDVHSLFAMGMSGGACPGLWLGRGACPQPRAVRWFNHWVQPSASLATEASNHSGGEEPPIAAANAAAARAAGQAAGRAAFFCAFLAFLAFPFAIRINLLCAFLAFLALLLAL